ncbi:CoxG family protein [Metabacillus fastidiosus]|uniref:SRPBCC family protein n=1 Tax=Metabacillus fastidiosus TaxID=1458 RepID=A0ABU6NS27_9BACI|nr:SRPBCC family protein [Metabacillus fastidiosus]MED4399938.1 SRPBCC family protein [Metabacillus fastidiosus]MED4462423.1 SRPBCC family protein [Metabacillus fastidiosus]
MPSYTYEVKVSAPIHSVWSFVSDINNWAPLVPGYIEHEILDDKASTWKFKADMGIIKKKVHLRVDITNWMEPSEVTFNLTGINEKFSGEGYFKARQLQNSQTIMTGYLSITAEGTMAKMVNSMLKTSLPEMTMELTEAVAKKIEEMQ